MLQRIIEYSVRNRFLVILVTLLLIAGGTVALVEIPLDAIPDLSDVQVIVLTEYPGQAPDVVEDQVTYPLTTAMLAVPYAETVRGYSFFGLSFVYIIFEDGTDIYWARSRVLEYLSYVTDRLPPGVNPALGPDATGVGWVYQYVLRSDRHNLAELRSIQDWFLRYELTSVNGVSEVASIGGFVKQYQVEVDPNKLLVYDIPLNRIKTAIQRSNNDVGGRVVEMAETEYMVRGLGYIQSVEDLENVALGVDGFGTPVFLHQVARVTTGPELRRGLAEWNGEGEIVGGIVVMRYGENAMEVIRNVEEKLESLKSGLPEGVEIITAYDRSNLIERAIDNLSDKLLVESLIVALVCIIFLVHFRSALVVILTLPISVLAAFLVMSWQGINANIMSLGGIAIAIGTLVDAAIVMIENTHKHMERDRGKKDHWRIVLDAAKEVGPSLFYSLLIITLSFAPIFALQAQEGRLFKPLAFTKTYTMAAAALLAITFVPVVTGYLVRGRLLPERRNPLSRLLVFLYRPVIRAAIRVRWLTVGVAVVALSATWYPLQRIGSEFMPPLYEGDLLYMPTTDPGISVTKARQLLQQTDRIIGSFPEVDRVFGKVGRADTATDPAPLSMIETTIMLRPEEDWRPGMTREGLVEALNDAIQFPGLTNAWTMPIRTRIDMLSTGIRTPVGIKIMGDDLAVLSDLAQQVAVELQDLSGTLSAFPEKTLGGNYLDFEIDRVEAARYGMTVGDVQDIIMSAVGGVDVTYTVEGLARYPVNIRYARELRDEVSDLRRVLIPTSSGAQIPISQVADIRIRKGPSGIKSENARPTAWVYVDLQDTDIGAYVESARRLIAERVSMPVGYSMVWSGQYEYLERAQRRLQIVVPVTLAIILLLLYMNFRNVVDSLIVMLSLPFALVGGVWLMYLLDYDFSIAVGVGFIALAGVAAETGVVMLLYLKQAYRDRVSRNALNTRRDLYEVVMHGAVERVRPKMMTVAATIAGLMPIMWGTGTGSEVMQRIAAPMVGGMVTSTVLTLVVIPVIYYMVRSWGLRKA
ncbi:MAG: efflux RND transporter permease subunit [Gemmatimonadetes bacterium]|nr:efflux RND transporter permease subunit [Gemmatimonadota bacterium]MYG85499.1 efflux RND transporter permease subunit [Gemmatimonadota bacterium]MYJ88240.1 efflux RND transporter permease subunit [Gemmatimonadota bacterium]